ncbi:MAG TPA: hemerythrin domain-containing protein [Rhodanobacteraceae bacterium]
MDATKLLTEDHEKVKKLLKQLNETSTGAGKSRTDLLDKIATELKVHTTIEEEIFYPAFKQACGDVEDDKLYFEALEEHRAAGELVLPDLQATDVGSEQFGGRAKVLKDLVEHHAEEEEDEMFKRARKVFSKDELEDLGNQLQARKQELMQQSMAA